MHLSISLLFSCATSIKVVTSTQSPYSRYNGLLCEQQPETCNRGVQSEQLPSVVENADTSAPILKQVFTTITRKHNNLNTAKANSSKAMNVKYQAGPSLEAEGESTESLYSKQDDSESPYSSEYGEASPDTIVPEQNIQGLSSDENFLGDQPEVMDDQLEEEQLPNWNSGDEQLLDEELEEQQPSLEDQVDIPPTPDTSDQDTYALDWQGNPQTSSEYGYPMNTMQLYPEQALMDQVSGQSSGIGAALSNSNEFDQAHVIDQTLYQTQPQQLMQPASQSGNDGYSRKYKEQGGHNSKWRYYGGNRY